MVYKNRRILGRRFVSWDTIFLLSERAASRLNRGTLSGSRKMSVASSEGKEKDRGKRTQEKFATEIIKVPDKSACSIPFT